MIKYGIIYILLNPSQMVELPRKHFYKTFLENLEHLLQNFPEKNSEMFPQYYIYSDVCSKFIINVIVFYIFV